MKKKVDITIEQYKEDITTMVAAIQKSGKTFDGIYGIPRGGYLPAIIAAKILNLPVLTEYTKDTLIVDDILDSGATMDRYEGYHRAVVYIQQRSMQRLKDKYKDVWFGRVMDGWLKFPDERGDDDIEDNIRRILQYIGEDPNREGLVGTPDRIKRMYQEIFRGYDPDAKPRITTFDNDMESTDMVFDTGEYYSMCEHHMMPFFGRYYFAYIPAKDGQILGISKIARVVNYCAARLQLQERLARNVIDMLFDALGGNVLGMAIVMKGKHLCKTMRGVKNQGNMCVAHLHGMFKENKECRDEFYKLIDLNSHGEQ